GNLSGVKSLTFRNINTGTTAATIRLNNDATNNTITNCIIEGAGTSTTTSGNIIFGTGVTTGNDNNTISNNDIRDRVTSGARPSVGILSLGSADPASNSHNTILNNNIFNFSSTGINVISVGGGNWTIQGNSFYYNSSILATAAHTSINFNPGLAANNNLIYENFIGGQAPNAGGGAWRDSAAAQFAGILATVGSTGPSTIRRNTVKNINLAHVGGSTFFGIGVVNGTATVDSNTVGDPTFVSRPQFVHTTASSMAQPLDRTAVGRDGREYDVHTPENAPSAVVELPAASDGPVQPVLSSPTNAPNSIVSSGTGGMTGILNQSSFTVVIADNHVSNMTHLGTGTAVFLRGISNLGTATSNTTISRNSVHDLASASTSTSLTAPAVAGIVWFPSSFTGGVGLVEANTVRAISATNTGAVATNAMGMLITNCDIPVVRNHVTDIRNASTGTTATSPPTATGIYMRFLSGALVANNMASVGNNQTTNTVFAAYWNGAGTQNSGLMYHNSGLVTGAAASGDLPSFTFLRGNHTTTSVFTSWTLRNNILANTRSGGTGKHYAIGNQGSRPDSMWTSATSNYNIFYNQAPSNLALWGTTDLTLAGWQSTTGGDAQTLEGDPGFASATDLHINPSSALPSNNATPIAAVTVDFDGETRSATTPDRGADEYVFVPPVTPQLTATPDSLNFGAVDAGQQRQRSTLVRNSGAGTLTVTNVTSTNPNYSATPTSFNLAANDTQRVTVTFTAPLPGGTNEIGVLRFTSNDPDPDSVKLVGRSGVPHVALNPNSFNFTRQAGPDTTRATMQVRNTGTDTLSYQLTRIAVLPEQSPSVLRSVTQQLSYELPKGARDSRSEPEQLDGRGGPDAFGYMYVDSDDPGGPQFNWTDIKNVGTQITTWTGSGDDGYAPVRLPFSFRFYGNPYDTVYVGTNGFMSFGAGYTTFSNTAIPSTATPNNAIYGFWDDMNFNEPGGTAWYYHDAANGRFIVQMDSVSHFSPGTTPGRYTYQTILYPNGDIIVQYRKMEGTLNSATIGIENSTGSIGLQVVFNAAYVRDSLAVRYALFQWVSTDRTSGTIAPGDSQAVEVRIHPLNVAPGLHTAQLRVTGNTPDTANA
ncbi:MAG TPA: hypothetical protein VNL69_10545, partial [Bacteroidota bacterium]|nr:hypothetical protein [Bacteroidota bacterium]